MSWVAVLRDITVSGVNALGVAASLADKPETRANVNSLIETVLAKCVLNNVRPWWMPSICWKLVFLNGIRLAKKKPTNCRWAKHKSEREDEENVLQDGLTTILLKITPKQINKTSWAQQRFALNDSWSTLPVVPASHPHTHITWFGLINYLWNVKRKQTASVPRVWNEFWLTTAVKNWWALQSMRSHTWFSTLVLFVTEHLITCNNHAPPIQQLWRLG